jgi:hypothetical protein
MVAASMPAVASNEACPSVVGAPLSPSELKVETSRGLGTRFYFEIVLPPRQYV